MTDLNPIAQGRVATIAQYLQEIRDGFEGRGSLKKHPDGMETKLKNVFWVLDRLKTEAPGHPIIAYLTHKADATRADIAQFRDAIKAGRSTLGVLPGMPPAPAPTAAQTPTSLSDVARSRLERIASLVNHIKEAMSQNSDNIELMRSNIKNAYWGLDRLREEAKGLPIVEQTVQILANVEDDINRYQLSLSQQANQAHPPAIEAPRNLSLITGQVPPSGLVFTWEAPKPAETIYLFVLTSWMGALAVQAALRGEVEGVRAYRCSGDADYIVDDATPQGERRYFALLCQLPNGDLQDARNLNLIAAEKIDGKVVYASGRPPEIIRPQREGAAPAAQNAPVIAEAPPPAAPPSPALKVESRFTGHAPSSVNLISGMIPRYGLVFAWEKSTPAVEYFLLALKGWAGSLDVKSILRGELEDIQVFSAPGDCVYIVDNATPVGERRYYTLMGLLSNGDIVEIRPLNTIKREEMDGGAVHYTSGSAPRIVQEPKDFFWMGYIQIEEGIRVQWQPTPDAAEYLFILSKENHEKQESISMLTSGQALWQICTLPIEPAAVILNTDRDEWPYFSLLCRDARGNYLDIQGLVHGRDDHNQVQKAQFLTETLRQKAVQNLERVLDNIKARAPEAARGFSWDDLLHEAQAANRWYPGHPLVAETLSYMREYKEKGEQEANLAQIERRVEELAEHLTAENPNHGWIAKEIQAILEQHPNLERANEVFRLAQEGATNAAKSESIYTLAMEAWQRGEKLAAIKQVEEALRLNPRFSNASDSLRRFKRQVEFEDALDVIGANPVALATLGDKQMRNDNPDLASLAYDRAFQYSEHKDHLWSIVRSHLEMNSISRAVERFLEAVKAGRPVGVSGSHDELKDAAAGIQAKADQLSDLVQELKQLQEERRYIEREFFDTSGAGMTVRRQYLNDQIHSRFNPKIEQMFKTKASLEAEIQAAIKKLLDVG